MLDADDADVVDDLGQEPGAQAGDHDDAARRDGPHRRPRWARSPWAVPALATAVVLLVGTASLHQVRVAAADGLARDQQLGAVQLSTPTVGFDSRTPRRDADGRMLADVQVQAFNAGSEPVALTALATSLTAAALLPSEEPLQLGPEEGRLLVLPLAVDCGAVPPLDQVVTIDPETGVADAGGETSWVRLAVDVDGERAERRYLVPGQSWTGGLSEQLAHACTPDPYSQDVTASTGVDVRGRLVASVSNRSQDPARLVLDVPTALRASSEPALPADLPAGSSLQLAVSLDPDCTLVGQDPGEYPLQAGVSLDLGQGSSWGLTDGTVTTAWVARQVALACG